MSGKTTVHNNIPLYCHKENWNPYFATKLWNERLICLGQQVRLKKTISTLGLITKVCKRQPESRSKKKYASMRAVKKCWMQYEHTV